MSFCKLVRIYFYCSYFYFFFGPLTSQFRPTSKPNRRATEPGPAAWWPSTRESRFVASFLPRLGFLLAQQCPTPQQTMLLQLPWPTTVWFSFFPAHQARLAIAFCFPSPEQLYIMAPGCNRRREYTNQSHAFFCSGPRARLLFFPFPMHRPCIASVSSHATAPMHAKVFPLHSSYHLQLA